MTAHDSVNHPRHYTSHPSGVECITVVEHMGFNLGNAIKYIWRADEKNDAIEDLQKAAWYIERELKRRTSADRCPLCGRIKDEAFDCPESFHFVAFESRGTS